MDNKGSELLRNLSLLTYLGLAMVTPIFAGVYIGNWLDNRLHSGRSFLVIFTILGVLAAFVNTYKITMKAMKKK